MKIAVIGVGGVGGYFGGRLARFIADNRAASNEIYFVARGKHLEAIRKNGLILNTREEGEVCCQPTLATDKITELPRLDLILLCVKSYDLPGALELLKPRLKPESLILPLLNGVDIYERIRTQITTGFIFPACVYVGTHIESPGRVTQRGGACSILLGPDPRFPEQPAEKLLSLLSAARIKHEWQNDPYPRIWEKFIFITAFGLVTAALDLTVGEVMDSSPASTSVKTIMSEMAELARRKSVLLPDNIVEKSYQTGGNFPPETRTSFQRDFAVPNRADERDLFGGAVIRMAAGFNLPVPETKLFYKKLTTIKPG